ncbi:MAG TPA: sulfotransferase [Caulobacteraceae bacterium]|jgi:Tfp pilus assembly protein PilF|nr:sulfotransferase [Caulobacteraceae bacterium]
MSDAAVVSDAEAETLFSDLREAVQRGERERALDLAERCEAADLEHPLILTLAAEAAEARADDERAAGLLRRAIDLAPEQAEAWRRFAVVLGRLGLLEPARTAADHALSLAPDAGPCLVAAGAAAFAVGDLAPATTHYEAAAASGSIEAIEALGAIAARRGQAKEARDLAGRALAAAPDRVGAVLTLARADLLEADPSAADRRLTELLAGAISEALEVAALDLRAEARDALGETDRAFADYQARNVRIARANRPTPGQERRLDEAHRLTTWFGEADARTWRRRAGDDREGAGTVRRHAFLVGFPRSGTTLIEKALASHPQVVTLEEVDCLGEAGRDFLAGPAQLSDLETIDQEEADRRRAVYWRGVRQSLGKDLAGKTLLDKLPLHTLALPVIAKLFPDATILFALRDPRDVVLSCFRRRFRQNAAMAEFLTLPDAARYYDAIMTLAGVYRALLSLEALEVRHEAIVADFDARLGHVLDALDLPWDDAVRGFAARAAARPRTPSDLQLAAGLNEAGLGQWRRYAPYLGGVRAILDPWAVRLGYSSA